MDYAQVMQNWHDQPYKDRERDLKMQQMLQQLTENATKDREDAATYRERRAAVDGATGPRPVIGADATSCGPSARRRSARCTATDAERRAECSGSGCARSDDETGAGRPGTGQGVAAGRDQWHAAGLEAKPSRRPG